MNTGCKIKRRMLVTHGILTLGEGVKDTHQEWQEKECGSPIFPKRDGSFPHGKSVCGSCAKGWTHEHNFMIDIPSNYELLRAAGFVFKF